MANLESYKLARNKWKNENRELIRASKTKWQEANRDYRRAAESARRARQRNAVGNFTKDDILRLQKVQKGRCACCQKKRKLSVDHIVSLAAGGTNLPSNLQLLCTSCNCSKSDKDPINFMRERGRLL